MQRLEARDTKWYECNNIHLCINMTNVIFKDLIVRNKWQFYEYSRLKS